MNAREFVNVQTVVDVWNGSTYQKMLGDRVWIDLNVITEVHPLKEDLIYKNNEERRYKAKIEPSKYAYIYRTTLHGHGLNGMSSDMQIDEASYHMLCEKLNLIES